MKISMLNKRQNIGLGVYPIWESACLDAQSPELDPGNCISQACCYKPVIPALRSWRQKDQNSKPSLSV